MSQTWADVLAGFVIVAVTIILVKMMYSWYIFRKSIQKELYSNFLEYYFKRKSIKKLSQSAYFNNEFGHHRIIYQLVNDKDKEKPLAYVLLALSSGIYALGIKSEKGQMVLKERGDFTNTFTQKVKKVKKEITVTVHNPVNEMKRFQRAIENKLNMQVPVYEYIVYPDKTKLEFNGEMKSITYIGDAAFINRKNLVTAINKIHTQSNNKLSDEEINKIYSLMTAEVTA